MADDTRADTLTSDRILAMPAGRELDALVARMMDLDVLGLAPCVEYPGGGPYVESLPSGEVSRYNLGMQPVYLRDCLCEYYRPEYGVKRFGHSCQCLGVVPDYSTDIAAAMDVLSKARWDGGWFQINPGHAGRNYVCIINNISSGDEKTISLAICKAALLAKLEAARD